MKRDLPPLFIKSKIQFFESKSQRIDDNKTDFIVVYQVKDTIFWKQITTIFLHWCNNVQLFIKSKIQFFESKSQLPYSNFLSSCGCLSSQRYNFLKANHNKFFWSYFYKYVVYQVKDTIFESKSQQVVRVCHLIISCLSSQRYNFLKANHNVIQKDIFYHSVVYQVKDTIFWKQITTFQLS